MLSRFVRACLWSRSITNKYDQAHNFQHHLNCLKNVEVIACKELETEQQREIAYLATIMHDVFDHKEVLNEIHLEQLKKTCLDVVFQQEKDDFQQVMKIINTMSYTKMKQNNGNPIPLKDETLEKIRDVVSDADKLEALGRIGVERCVEYLYGHYPSTTNIEIVLHVVKHAKEKLLHLDDYIKTQTGLQLAKPRMNEFKCEYQKWNKVALKIQSENQIDWQDSFKISKCEKCQSKNQIVHPLGTCDACDYYQLYLDKSVILNY